VRSRSRRVRWFLGWALGLVMLVVVPPPAVAAPAADSPAVLVRVSTPDFDEDYWIVPNCAYEGEICTAHGLVKFGAGAYITKVMNGSFRCDVATFGDDPVPGVKKECTVVEGVYGWDGCAQQGETCPSTDGPRVVAYGRNGVYARKILTGDVPCADSTFGDPFPGMAKHCAQARYAPTDLYWQRCAHQGETCRVAPGVPVLYGAYGSYVSRMAMGDIPCSEDGFVIDPMPGVFKGCYIRSGKPPGFQINGAVEGQMNTFTGTRSVAFGAHGVYLVRTFTGSHPCTAAAFGGGPFFAGVPKRCYIML
jgi:hypothetical protein